MLSPQSAPLRRRRAKWNSLQGVCFRVGSTGLKRKKKKESESLSAGSTVVSTFEVPKFGKVGVAICYDIRFAAAIELLARDCKLLVIPAAFNMTTG